MGNPALFGIKKNGGNKVTYVHNFGGFMDGLSYSTMYHVCKFVHEFSNEQLVDMYNHIVPEENEENIEIAYEREQEKFERKFVEGTATIIRDIGHGANSDVVKQALNSIENTYNQFLELNNGLHVVEYLLFKPSETFFFLVDFFKEASEKLATTDGQIIIPDYSKSLDNYGTHFIIDLDKEMIDVSYNCNIFQISFSEVRRSTIENVENAVRSFGNLFSYLHGRLDNLTTHNLIETTQKFYANENQEYLERYDSGKMSQKGQLTIPVEVREALKIKEGDRLEFALSHHKIKSVEVKEKKNLNEVRGILGHEDEEY